ncbi:MAG: hypothetical protein EXQ95_00820 [Alphaproteobacteria bacterium]|nr:hypothetical protein [Alphaproteobacteria bacterium]
MATLLTERGRFETGGLSDGESLWVAAAALAEATGWDLKPEGFCRDAVCVPLPPGRESQFRRGGEVDAARLWRHAGQPIVASRDRATWSLGTSAALRASTLESLEAPDVALPDLDGRIHRLSDHRGKKVFLSTWASW